MPKIIKVLGIMIAVFSISVTFANYSGLITKIKKSLSKPHVQKHLSSDNIYRPQNLIQYRDVQTATEVIQVDIKDPARTKTKKADLESAKGEPAFNQSSENRDSIYLQDVLMAEGFTIEDRANNKLFVEDNLKIRIRSLPEAIIGEKYNVRLITEGGCPPYKWKLASGRLPEGIYLDNEAGVLFGTPRKGEGTTFTIKVTDDKGNHKLFNFTLVVLENSCITDTAGPLSIITNSLPDAIVGRDYYKQILAKGGWPPCNWTVSAGALPENLCLHNKSGVLYGVPQREGKSNFVVKVTDQKNNFVSANLTLLIKTGPLYIISGSLPEAYVGVSYYQRLEAQGGFPPYKWQIISGSLPEGISFDSHCALLSGIPQKSQKTTFKVKVTDTKQNYDIAEFMINVNEEALKIVTAALDGGAVGKSYYYPLYAQGGRPPYRWETTTYFPKGLVLNQESGSISGIPLESCDIILYLTVVDVEGRQAGANLQLMILNEPLTIEGPFLLKANVGTELYRLLCAYGGSPPYTWEVVSGELPKGITFDKDKGTLSGTPIEAQVRCVNIKVVDQSSKITSADFTFEIQDTELAILTTDIPSLEMNRDCSFLLQAEGGRPPYQWRLKSGSLPNGLTLNSQGLLSGIPIESGDFSLEVEVTDANADCGSSTFLLTVRDNSLSITTDFLPEGVKNVQYYFTLEAIGGTKPYQWRIASGGLPEWITLAENTGVLSGVPAKGQKLPVTIEVEDVQGNFDEGAFIIKITGDPLSILTTELIEGRVGESYAQKLLAEGGVQPYLWRIVTGNLPQGLSLNSQSGLISGVPEDKANETLEVEVSDSEGDCCRATFFLKINKSDKPIGIITGSLPTARLNKYYEANLEAEGGTLPYIWSLNSGSLPEGLILNSRGKILGIPKITGNFSLHIRVKDDQDIAASKDFMLSIKNAPDPVTGFIACPSDGKIGLCWVNPSGSDFTQVKIIRSTASFPKDPNEEELVYSGTEDNLVDANLANGVTYYYCAFAFYKQGDYSDITEGSRSSVTPKVVTLYGDCDPFVDEVISFNPLSGGGFGAKDMPQVVLGPPKGGGVYMGSLDVVSLHSRINNDDGRTPPYGGSVTLKFNDNIVVNKEGPDFTAFENVFYIGGDPQMRWMEPATVAVSQDGSIFYTFPVDFVPHYDKEGNINYYNPYCYSRGFTGVNPVYSNNGSPDPADPSVSGGDSFDLSEISTKELKWIRYVRITATGDNWLTDINGDKVRHNIDMGACSGAGSSGFDLDAVCAINY